MSPKNKKKLNILRIKLDKLDNKLIDIIKIRTNTKPIRTALVPCEMESKPKLGPITISSITSTSEKHSIKCFNIDLRFSISRFWRGFP